MSTRISLRIVVLLTLIASIPCIAEDLPSIADRVGAAERQDGFFRFYMDRDKGRVLLEIPEFDREFLYVNSLSSGLGSNPVGLDRGQLGRTRIVKWVRMGGKVLLMQPNLRFRAQTDNSLERRAVEESFAQSVIWGGTIAARTGDSVLVDLTDFLMRDAHNVVRTLRGRNQGSYSLDAKRSAIYPPRTKNFPDNSEFEALLTFQTNGNPGPLVSEVAPSPDAVTLRQHHSFIRLPQGGFTPRRFDPRSGAISVRYADYAAPLDAPLERRYAIRHRLQKKDPSAAVSEAVEPLIYYVDSGAPKQIQQALIEGASWWNQAFEAAGFRNAFRVEVLPPDADPMDVRYNVIQWVHRSTRGWSYGASVVDPRTGEILKGHVSLGSLRVRQDRLIFEGMQEISDAAGHDSAGLCLAALSPPAAHLAKLDPDADPVEVALARIRQLSAHEVGHTLGFVHNFAASTYGRASVMDYPAPLIQLDDQGKIDLSDAYAVGIGEWDKISVRFSYSHFTPGSDEQAQLDSILREAIDKGYRFISDADSRPLGAAHPYAHLWDNGEEPVSALVDLMRVRRTALQQFGEGNLADGEPLALLQNTLVPLYLHHRFQVDAAAKVLAGVDYSYAIKGDGQKGVVWISPDEQKRALSALLDTLSPQELTLPRELLESLPPLPLGYFDARERFSGRTGRIFDPLSAARVAADITLRNLLQPQRAARMESQHSMAAANPSLGEVVDALFDRTWGAAQPSDSWQAAVAREVETAAVDHLQALAANPSAAERVRAASLAKLVDWHQRLEAMSSSDQQEEAHRLLAIDTIKRFLQRPAAAAQEGRGLRAPPGSPIGQP